MGDNFLSRVLDRRALLPPAWQDWLPEGDLARLIPDAVVRRGAQRMNFWCPTGLEMRSYRTAPNHL